jgi:23S rRNA pseudouridine1911/1915/1917 synthase
VTDRSRVATTSVVEPRAAGERLDRWLAAKDGAPTRSQIATDIRAGRVKVNGRLAKAGERLRGGETVEVEPRSMESHRGTEPEAIEIAVLYEDDDVVAIDKAAGMVVHPAVGNRSGTLVHALLHRFPRSRWPGEPDRAGIVHRLDRDTSGVILVARNVAAHEALSRQFRERTIEKEYHALVHGRVLRPGEIDAPIGRHPSDRKRMSVVARRSRVAVTVYEPIDTFRDVTLLRVLPRTGRTHQIRVHLAASGWPIVSDPIYGRTVRATGSRAPEGGKGGSVSMPRLALHAARIAFDHPATGRRVQVRAPRPPDFEAALRVLRRQRKG